MQSDKDILEEARNSSARVAMALVLIFQGAFWLLMGIGIGWLFWHR
ncbi:MAG: hypothetical protein HY053_06160 [Proteobacteria bacterium]|nr:hypothetical protein [Pseudomonadota bacterium]